MPRGKFIVFEGMDGSGKSTQAKLLFEYLTGTCKNNGCVLTAEPTSDPIGALCREIGAGKILAAADTQALLFAADRLEHVKSMLAELESGNHVICDRYYISSLAYQSVNCDFDNILAYNKVSMELLKPDAVFYIHLTPDVCSERLAKRKGTADIYERLDFARKVYERYRYALERLATSERIFTIDGSDEINAVFGNVLRVMNESVLG